VGQEKGALMITNSNQVNFAKVLGREVQEGVLGFLESSRPKVLFDANTYLSSVLVKIGY
jgi:hypothetical protein